MNRTRWIASAAAALAIVVGGGAALAASGSSNPADDFMGDVAKRLGISQDRLEGAIEDATNARIDAAVAAGDITKEEGEALKARARSGDMPAILPGFDGPGHGLGAVGPPGVLGHGRLGPPEKGILPGAFPGSDLMERAADYLGMTGADVREALREGKSSLADLAKDKGRSVVGLKRALRDAIRGDADQAVENGVLTEEQADRLAERLGSVMDRLVEGGLRDDLDFDFRGGDGKFEFHLRIAPG